MSGVEFDEIRRFKELDSTNTYLLGEARRGVPEGMVAVADHQTAGRGRLGRKWEAPAGACLLVSVLLRPVLAPEELHLCTGMVALAGMAASRSVAGVTPVLKWPNDLLLGEPGREAKVAGILAESDPGAGLAGGEAGPGPGAGASAGAGTGAGGTWAVVVGMGLNLDWPGPEGAGGTTLASVAGRPVDREEFLSAFLGELRALRPRLDAPAGRRALAGELRAACATLGRQVRVELADRSLTGVAVDLTDSGYLLLDTASGIVEISAGDVVHLWPH